MSADAIGALVSAIIPVLGGIYATLLGHRVIGKKAGEDWKYDDWHSRHAGMLKRLGPGLAIFGLVLAASGLRSVSSTLPLDPKYQELRSLPVGLNVTHSPVPVKAQRGGRSGRKYTWLFTTSVRSLDEEVTISDFGAFGWKNGRWVFSTITGKPFTAKDFADWYSCPGAKILQDKEYEDPNNFVGGDVLQSSKELWYFIGVTPSGRRVKGEAPNESVAELEG